jgi:hypothetical protein
MRYRFAIQAANSKVLFKPNAQLEAHWTASGPLTTTAT